MKKRSKKPNPLSNRQFLSNLRRSFSIGRISNEPALRLSKPEFARLMAILTELGRRGKLVISFDPTLRIEVVSSK